MASREERIGLFVASVTFFSGCCWGKRKLDFNFLSLSPQNTFSFFPLLNQQVLPQSTVAAAAAAPPWHTTMLPDQSGCIQAMTQLHAHIHMLLIFTALRGFVPRAWNSTHMHTQQCFNSAIFWHTTQGVCSLFELKWPLNNQNHIMRTNHALRGEKVSYLDAHTCKFMHVSQYSAL